MNLLQLIEKSTKKLSQVLYPSRPSQEWADYITNQRNEIDKIDCSNFKSFLMDLQRQGATEKELFAMVDDIDVDLQPNRKTNTGGRLPPAYQEPQIMGEGIGVYFAKSAHEQAAAVFSYIALATQLRSFGAPTNLIEQCQSAAKDNILHAKIMQELSEMEGVFVPSFHYVPTSQSILEVAMQNAVDGCIYETWAALLANWQSTHLPSDPELQTVYEQIGKNKAMHGQLAWDLHFWFLSKLRTREKKQLSRAQSKAIAQLLLAEGNISYVAGLGLPLSHEKKVLSSVFCAQLVA